MPLKKIKTDQPRRKKAFERFKNRVPLPAMLDRKQQDILIIDKTLTSLYNDGDKIIRSLQEDILKNNKINLTEKDTERIWDILMNSGLVHAVIGFGNTGKMDLTQDGYHLMSQFGSYSAFIEEQKRQVAQQNQTVMPFPQFIIEQSKEEDPKEGGEEEKKAVGKKTTDS